MESQVILVRTERQALKDPEASPGPRETLDSKEIREIVERVYPAPGDPQDLQEQEFDLLLWTWRALDSPIWSLCGDFQGHQVPPVLPVPPCPPAQWVVLEHLGPQGEMEHPVNLAYLVYQVPMAYLELLVPREKRVIQASWGFQE